MFLMLNFNSRPINKEVSRSKSALVQTSREPSLLTGWMTQNDFTALGLHFFIGKIRRKKDGPRIVVFKLSCTLGSSGDLEKKRLKSSSYL